MLLNGNEIERESRSLPSLGREEEMEKADWNKNSSRYGELVLSSLMNE